MLHLLLTTQLKAAEINHIEKQLYKLQLPHAVVKAIETLHEVINIYRIYCTICRYSKSPANIISNIRTKDNCDKYNIAKETEVYRILRTIWQENALAAIDCLTCDDSIKAKLAEAYRTQNEGEFGSLLKLCNTHELQMLCGYYDYYAMGAFTDNTTTILHYIGKDEVSDAKQPKDIIEFVNSTNTEINNLLTMARWAAQYIEFVAYEPDEIEFITKLQSNILQEQTDVQRIYFSLLAKTEDIIPILTDGVQKFMLNLLKSPLLIKWYNEWYQQKPNEETEAQVEHNPSNDGGSVNSSIGNSSLVGGELTDAQVEIISDAFFYPQIVYKLVTGVTIDKYKPWQLACLVAVLDDYGLVKSRYSYDALARALCECGANIVGNSLGKTMRKLPMHFHTWDETNFRKYKALCMSFEQSIKPYPGLRYRGNE